MKKLLLLSALAVSALAANADYSDYFKVYHNGNEVKNGETILYTDYEELLMSYDLKLNLTNEADYDFPLYCDMLYKNYPTQQEAEANVAVWGSRSVCYESSRGGSCFPSLPNLCMLLPDILDDGSAYDFDYLVELVNVAPETVSIYDFVIIPCEGDSTEEGHYELLPDDKFTVSVIYAPNEEAAAGVDSVGIDMNAPVEYFNIQGMKVTNPENGLYIVKQGNKVTKRFIRK